MPVPILRFHRPARLLLLGLLLPILLSLGLHGRFRSVAEHSGDAQSYLTTAHNLARHGVFSESTGIDPAPALGREPGYPLLLAALIRAGTPLQGFTPACLAAPGACPDALYRPARWANLLLALAAAAILGGVAWRLTGSVAGASLACAYVALNQQMLRGRWEVLSDHLALLLVALLLALLLDWLRAPSAGRAAGAGLAAAGLILTKAIFLPALLLAALGWLALRRLAPGRAPRFAAVALLAGLLPVLAWMGRNYLVAGVFALTDARSGIALSTREVFDAMGPRDIACAFVYWTRGMGDGLARLLFAPAVWQPFALDFPGGYYDLGQHRYLPWVARVTAEQGLTEAAARTVVDRALLTAIAGDPLGWLGSYPPLFWRGLWIDEFVVLGFPALVAATLWAVRRRRLDWLALLAPGWFCLLVYPAISLNIPRYQIPAVPVLALATAWAGTRLLERRAGVSPVELQPLAADDAGPFLGLPPHPVGEFLRRGAQRHAAQRGEALLRLRHFEQRVDLGVDAAHRLGRHGGRAEQAEPGIDLGIRQLRQGLPRCRHLRQLRAALGAGHRQGTQLAAADVLDHPGQVVHQEADIAGQHLHLGRAGAAERHVDRLGLQQLQQPDRGQMGGLPDPGGGEADLARLGAQPGGEFGHGVDRGIGVHHHHVGAADLPGDRHQLLGLVGQVAEQRIADRLRPDIARQQRAAIGAGADHFHGADGAAGRRRGCPPPPACPSGWSGAGRRAGP